VAIMVSDQPKTQKGGGGTAVRGKKGPIEEKSKEKEKE